MENSADTMTCVGANHAVAGGLDRVGDDIADLAVHFVRRTVLN